MKKLIMYSLILSTVAFASCEKKSNPPSHVKKAFDQRESAAEDLEWEYDSEDKLWEVEYRNKANEFSSKFDENGKWLETEKTVLFSELPEALQEVLKAVYADYKIVELEWIDTPHGVFYEVDFELESGEEETELELLFSADGKIIQN